MPSLKARLRITEKCKGKCWYCYISKTEKDMSLDTVDLILNKLKEIFYKGRYSRVKISLTGGDPTQHPNFLEITKTFFEGFPKVYVMTDACSSADFESIKKFVDLGGSFLVSLNEDPIESVLEFAKFGKEKKILNYVNVLFTPFNISRLDEILRKIVVENDLKIRFNHLYNSNDSSEFKESILQAIEKIGKFLIENDYQSYNYLLGFLTLDKVRHSHCGYGENFYYFDTDGNVQRCNEELPICHVSDPNMENLFKRKPEISVVCKNCKDYIYCMGGCFFANKGNGEFCKEYKATLEIMKEIKLRRDQKC